MATGTDFREDALQSSFPNVGKLGLKVKHRENSDFWCVDAIELEKALRRENGDMTWWGRNGYWVVLAFYGLLFLGAYLGILPSWMTRRWY